MISDGFLKDKRLPLIMLASLIWGIVAHGMAMFVKFSYHDDVPWFNGVGETYGLGRWFLAIESRITEALWGSMDYSVPAFNGVLTIAGIAFTLYLLCRKLEIKDRLLIVSLCGVFVCFPSVTNIFGFIFTAPQYYVGAMFGVAGAYLLYTYDNVPTFLICTFLMALSVGVYQSNIPVNLMVLLLFMLDRVCSTDMKWKEYIILALKNALVCVCFMGQYFLYNLISLKAANAVMYDYKGVNSFGYSSPEAYIYRIYTAYKRFIKPADHINYDGVSNNMFPWNIKYFHMLLIAATLILIVYLLRSSGTLTKIAQISILIAVSPLFAYFVYVMVDEDDAHGGMGYGAAFMFILAAYIIERTREYGRTARITANAGIALMLVIGLMFARYANICYLKVQVMQTEAISYYNRLIARIESVDGYTADTPVAYIGGNQKNEDEASVEGLFDPIYLPPFQGNSIINDFSWKETMRLWCGFSPVIAEDDALSETGQEQITQMPCYPASGSIKMIDDVLVVKFAE